MAQIKEAHLQGLMGDNGLLWSPVFRKHVILPMMEVWNGGVWKRWQALNIICMLITSNLYRSSAFTPEL